MQNTLKILIALFCCLTTLGCNYGMKRVPTSAMLPTIPIDSYVLTDEGAYSGRESIERFDLVIHNAPTDKKLEQIGLDKNTKFIFRVIGLSGEKVEIRNGKVLINDAKIVENFETIPSQDDFGPLIVPDNEYFLLGDNRPGSDDSRYWKSVTIRRLDIIGKVVKIF